MIVYIIFLSILFILLTLDKLSLGQYVMGSAKQRESQLNSSSGMFLWIALLLIFLFTAFRFNIGWDYMAYYHTVADGRSTNIVNNGELLNNLIVSLSQQLNLTNFYFFSSSFIIFFLIFYTVFKYSQDDWLSLIFFITFPLFYLNSLSVIRTFMALGICFYAFKYLVEHQLIKYIALVVIASFFHRSSLIALTFIAALYIDLTLPRMMGILFASPLVSWLMTFVIINFFSRYGVYLSNTPNREGTKAIIVLAVLGAVSLAFRERLIENDPVTRIALNIYCMGLGIYLLFYRQGTLGHRLSLYGTIYALLLIPKLISLFPSKMDRVFISALVYSIGIIMFLYTIYVSAEAYIPYRIIW